MAVSNEDADRLVSAIIADNVDQLPLLNALREDIVITKLLRRVTRVEADGVDDDALPDGPTLPDASVAAHLAPRDEDPVSRELMDSYHVTMMLAHDDPSASMIPCLTKQAKLITKSIFQVFEATAQGNLRHGCRIIDHLMRVSLNDMYEVMGRNVHTVKRYMGSMLQYMEYAPVAEVFVTLISKPHNTMSLRYYSSASSTKWMFYRALSEWRILLVLVEHITSQEYPETHCVGTADVFVELLDRLAADENGEILLMPAAHCPELVEKLVNAAVDRSASRTTGQRTAAMKCLLALLHKCSMEQVQGPPTSPYQSFGATVVNLVPNQLASLREPIYELVEKHMGKLLQYLLDQHQDQQKIELNLEGGKPLPACAVRHTGYVVKTPFTELRLILVDTLVAIVTHNPSPMFEHFDVHVWRVLVAWFFEYSHNNLYHAAFYQLVFIALRSENQATLEILIKKLKLVTLLIEHYRDATKSTSNNGYILRMCNAIRLQATSQSPDAFLRHFLQSHTTWRNFEPELRELTRLACTTGLGFNVPQALRQGYEKDTWQTMEEVQGIDHGSEYAKSLGFLDDVAWPEEDVSEPGKKKKKKKKKKSKNHAGEEDPSSQSDSQDEWVSAGLDQAEVQKEEQVQSNGHASGRSPSKKSKAKKKKNKKK